MSYLIITPLTETLRVDLQKQKYIVINNFLSFQNVKRLILGRTAYLNFDGQNKLNLDKLFWRIFLANKKEHF